MKLNNTDKEILNTNVELFNAAEEIYKQYLKVKDNKEELFKINRIHFDSIRELLFKFSDCEVSENKKFDAELNHFQSYINFLDDLCMATDKYDIFMIDKQFRHIEITRDKIQKLLKNIK